MLVDDETAIRDICSQTLIKFGYTVLTATSGEEALELFSNREKQIDLTIMDLGMPGMGGLRCLQEIRRIHPSAKVLIASGYSIEGTLDEALKNGAVGFVTKPFQLNDLLYKIRNALDGETIM